MSIYIYGLVDPLTDEIRYIGKTIRLSTRLSNHCNAIDGTRRSNWIQKLIRQGVRPTLRILEELPDGAIWQEIECKWIAHGRDLGWNLTNATSGGDGVPDLPLEVRQRMAMTWTGRKHRPDSLEKIGKASKGRKHSAEWKENMSNLLQNRQFSEDTRQKISIKLRKLTDDQVQDVLRRRGSGETQASVARFYNVDPSTIANIVKGKLKYCQDAETQRSTPSLFDADATELEAA